MPAFKPVSTQNPHLEKLWQNAGAPETPDSPAPDPLDRSGPLSAAERDLLVNRAKPWCCIATVSSGALWASALVDSLPYASTIMAASMVAGSIAMMPVLRISAALSLDDEARGKSTDLIDVLIERKR